MMFLMMAAASIASTAIPVQVVDLDTKKPIAAHVIAWDEYFWSGFHSSGRTCFRAAGIMAQPPRSELVLPAVTNPKAGDNPRHAQALAFARGYCAVTPNAFTGFAHPDAPRGIVPLGGDAKGLQAGVPLTVRTRASTDPAEYRLLYLAEVARTVAWACFDQADRGFAKAMMDEVLSEADSIPKTFHEQFLARRVHEAAVDLQTTQSHPQQASVKIFGPLIPREKDRSWSLDRIERSLDIARAGPFKPPWCGADGHCAAGQAPRDTLIPPDPYAIDLRDEDGRTLLMHAAYDVNMPAVKLALSYGADARLVDRPGGLSALDVVLARAEKDVGETAPAGVELHLMRIIDALVAAHGSLHPASRQVLARPETWKVGERARAFWIKVAAKLAHVSVRDAFNPACATSDLAKEASLTLGTASPQ